MEGLKDPKGSAGSGKAHRFAVAVGSSARGYLARREAKNNIVRVKEVGSKVSSLPGALVHHFGAI